ncbi:MAG: fatty acid CoA ligase family protein [Planctomycetota bacterium]
MNVADHLTDVAGRFPKLTALVLTQVNGKPVPRWSTALTFSELEAKTNRCANGFLRIGITQGMRVLVLVRPGFEFVAVMFALFRLGSIPVLIDPGMGVARWLECIRDVNPAALIGLPQAHAVRVLHGRTFRNTRINVTVGRKWFWGGSTLSEVETSSTGRFSAVTTKNDDPAAILFTSGSTGPAKGVVYTHGMFGAQIRAIQGHYGIETGKEVDLPGFAPFALFSVAMGMTTVFPNMDFSRPGRVDPARIFQSIHDYQVTSTFGSPAMWKRVAAYCIERNLQLPSLRRVMIAGAPVPGWLVEQIKSVLKADADVHTPYGATEALPVTSMSGQELTSVDVTGLTPLAQSRAGRGTCVGVPVIGMAARLIRITDDPILAWTDDLEVGFEEPGEIAVSGPVVTKEYFARPDDNRLSKVHEGDRVWHRMGDLGLKDAQGRIWFLGRKAHRVVTPSGTLFTEPCEAVFNEHLSVDRSALVGLGSRGQQTPVVIVEPKKDHWPRGKRTERFRNELLRLARAREHTRDIHTILFHRSLPVDVRHNAKIRREDLARWAAKQIGSSCPDGGS